MHGKGTIRGRKLPRVRCLQLKNRYLCPMLEDFCRYLAAERRYSPLTVRNYRRDVERFAAWIEAGGGVFDPCAVEVADIRAWIVARCDEGLKAASVNREVSSLRAFFRYLFRTGRIGRELFRGLPSLRTPGRLPVFVPETRMERVVERCCPDSDEEDFRTIRNALIVLMLYGCGLRLAELVGIDRSDLASDGGTLRVRGKGGKERIVPLPGLVRKKIEHYRTLIERLNICNSTEKALILTSKGGRVSRSTVSRAVKEELSRSGVQGKRSPHVLRHTYATHLLNEGADMREIQELLGHASLQATQVYTHNSIARLQEAYTKAHPRGKGGRKEINH